jgi:hypothetical protein
LFGVGRLIRQTSRQSLHFNFWMHMKKLGIAFVGLLLGTALLFVVLRRGEEVVSIESVGTRESRADRSLSSQQKAEKLDSIRAPLASAVDNAVTRSQPKQPVFNQDPFKVSPDERLVSINRGIELMFGKTIRALKLTPVEEAKLRSLLVGRAEAAYIAHEVVSERDHKPGDLRDVIAAAQAEVDRDIKEGFEATTAKKIQLMLMASQYLARVNQSIDRAMTEAGEPLTPEQVLPLAVILMETYGSPNNPHTKPTLANVDPATSLTVADELVLHRASTLLSERQIDALQQLVVSQNKTVLGRNSGFDPSKG